MTAAYFAAAMVPGWIFLLFADCLVDGWFFLKNGVRAAPPGRRPAAFFFAGSAAPMAALGLWALARGAGGAMAFAFAIVGAASSVSALAANRLCGRWWRVALCAASIAALAGAV